MARHVFEHEGGVCVVTLPRVPSGCASGRARKRPVTEPGIRVAWRAPVRPLRRPVVPRRVRSMTWSACRMVSSSRPPPACCRCCTGHRAYRAARGCRVDADRWSAVEDVTHALQVRPELRGEPDALRFATPRASAPNELSDSIDVVEELQRLKRTRRARSRSRACRVRVPRGRPAIP